MEWVGGKSHNRKPPPATMIQRIVWHEISRFFFCFIITRTQYRTQSSVHRYLRDSPSYPPDKARRRDARSLTLMNRLVVRHRHRAASVMSSLFLEPMMMRRKFPLPPHCESISHRNSTRNSSIRVKNHGPQAMVHSCQSITHGEMFLHNRRGESRRGNASAVPARRPSSQSPSARMEIFHL